MTQAPKPQQRAADASAVARNVVVLEAAWEVCNQVGGIYQVLRSKAGFMTRNLGEHYVLLGPYCPRRATTDFEPSEPPPMLADALQTLQEEGVEAYFGRWLVAGRPQVLLLGHDLACERLDALKRQMRQQFGIESPLEHHLVDNAIAFGHVLARAALAVWGAARGSRLRTLVHCHEWQSGVAIPILSSQRSAIFSVFTTHATLLGRYIASSNDDRYRTVAGIDPVAQAERYGIKAQHQIERCCAALAHAFTTVSPVTGEECRNLLGKSPDFITPNGIDVQRYDAGCSDHARYSQFRHNIRRFVRGHFFPSYSFDLDQTLFFFTSGRYEPRNKGFDLCLEALAKLNADLKRHEVDATVVFFIVTQRPTRSLSPQRGRGVLDELRLPLSSTHVLEDEAQDEILGQIRALKLVNDEQDPVKVVYHPQFIRSDSPLWQMEYEQFVRGCDMGVFPSSYEPWGYTPLECVCLGVPAVTSDLSGFGRYFSDLYPDGDDGVFVLRRRAQDRQSSAAELANRLLLFCRLDPCQRAALGTAVQTRAHAFDWNKLGEAYFKAHRFALTRSKSGI